MERGSTLTSKVQNSGCPEEIGETTSDPFPADWTEVYPFDQLKPGHIDDIVDRTIAECERIVKEIISATAHTKTNILTPISEINDAIWRAFSHLQMWLVHHDISVREAAKLAEIRFVHYISDLNRNQAFYEQYMNFGDTYEGQHLSKLDEEISKMTYNDFRSSGMRLSRVKRDRLRELDHRLLECEVAFDYNLLDDTTSVHLSEAEIIGISDRFRETLERDPETGNYIVTMDYPTFFPFMRQVSSREGRRKVSRAFNSRAKGNVKILDEIITIRQEMAELLGNRSWAQIGLKESMAKSLQEILGFYDRLIEPLTARAREEVALMTGIMLSEGHKGPLQAYDVDYYEGQVVKLQHGIDHERVAEYFPLDVVMEGLFDITGKLFNIRYRQVNMATWHPDVLSYVIEDADTGQEIAMFHMDLFPREGKYKHACATSIVPGREMPDKSYRKPVGLIIANYTPPTADRPSLLSQDERAGYQYHEFGHTLHHCLTEAKYTVMSGFGTEIDMAEVPSQTMEFWGWEPELMVKHSRHYRTGKPMSLSMAKRLADSKNVNVALRTLERMRKGMFDLAAHMSKEPQDLRQMWCDISNEIGVIPLQQGTYFPATFGHIATAGYAANYHGYERVMPACADIFERIKARGLTDPKKGMEFRYKLLARGYTLRGADIIKDLLGKVDDQPYLRSLGITAVL